MLLARPFRLIHLLLRPLVWVVESVSGALLRWRGGNVFTGHLFGNREELRLVMQESGQAFSSEERAMINRVLDLQSLTVRQAVTPIAESATVTAHWSASTGTSVRSRRQRSAWACISCWRASAGNAVSA